MYNIYLSVIYTFKNVYYKVLGITISIVPDRYFTIVHSVAIYTFNPS